MTDDMGNEIPDRRHRGVQWDMRISLESVVKGLTALGIVGTFLWGGSGWLDRLTKQAADTAVTNLRIDTLQREVQADRAETKQQINQLRAEIQAQRVEQHQATQEINRKLDRMLERQLRGM